MNLESIINYCESRSLSENISMNSCFRKILIEIDTQINDPKNNTTTTLANYEGLTSNGKEIITYFKRCPLADKMKLFSGHTNILRTAFNKLYSYPQPSRSNVHKRQTASELAPSKRRKIIDLTKPSDVRTEEPRPHAVRHASQRANSSSSSISSFSHAPPAPKRNRSDSTSSEATDDERGTASGGQGLNTVVTQPKAGSSRNLFTAESVAKTAAQENTQAQGHRTGAQLKVPTTSNVTAWNDDKVLHSTFPDRNYACNLIFTFHHFTG